MTDKQLEENERHATTFKHPITGEAFNELAAAHLAVGVKRNPNDMARVKRIAPRFPGLTEALSANFPDDEDFIWADVPARSNVRDANEYRNAAMGAIMRQGPRVSHLLHYAERDAGRIALVDDGSVNDAEAHLREERIDALASLMTLFSLPDRYAVSPVEEPEDGDEEPAGGYVARRNEEICGWAIGNGLLDSLSASGAPPRHCRAAARPLFRRSLF